MLIYVAGRETKGQRDRGTKGEDRPFRASSVSFKTPHGVWGYPRRLSAAGGEGGDEVEIIEEVDDAVLVEVRSGVVDRKGCDEIEVIEEIYGVIVIEVGGTGWGDVDEVGECVDGAAVDEGVVVDLGAAAVHESGTSFDAERVDVDSFACGLTKRVVVVEIDWMDNGRR